MAKISNKEWFKYLETKSARGASRSVSAEDIKKQAYDTLFEVSNSWGSAFGANLREAVYCHWWDSARQMLDVKPDSKSKERALTVINDLENMAKGE
jgi:hypothetical protein